ncbi:MULTISPECIES: XRE family transcriptional regulator [Mycolicibacterium]|nr:MULTISPECIES: XRE family transcriptional regulator [Mycolicibacterium]
MPIRSGVTRNALTQVEAGRRGLLFERLYDLADPPELPVAQLLVDDETR